MGSKYDAFWLKIIDVLVALLEEAYVRGRSRAVDVSDLHYYGNRRSWYGSVVVSRNRVIRGDMAHARSLGKILVREGVLERFGDSVFVLKISNNLVLHVELLRRGGRVGKEPRTGKTFRGGVFGDGVVDKSVYLWVHELLEYLPIHRYPFVTGELPRNGIYFFYEESEFLELGGRLVKRVVRVGTHREDSRLPQRLANHFKGNRASSVYRRHLADALLTAAGVPDPLIQASLDDEIEALVSNILKRRFSFSGLSKSMTGMRGWSWRRGS